MRDRMQQVQWQRIAFASLAVVLLATASGAGAQSSARSMDDLRDRITDDYEVLVVRSGLVLRPHDDTEFRSLEVVGDEIFVDGEKASADRLEDLLGARDAATVRRLTDLSTEDQRRLFEGSRDDASLVPSAPAAPGLPAPPAPPEPPRRRRTSNAGPKVTIGGSVEVPAGETAEDAVAVGGTVLVDGEVTGDAVGVGGTVTINGRVTGDAVSVGASVILGPNAEVLGDVTSVGGRVVKPETATIGGQVQEVSSFFNLDGLRLGQGWNKGRWRGGIDLDDDDDTFWSRGAAFVSRAFRIAFYGLLACLAVLLVPRPIDRMRSAIARDPWKQGLIGLVTQILFFPVMFLAFLILLVSIIGIPLLVLLPVIALLAMIGAFLGLAAVAEQVGTWTRDRFGWNLPNRYVLVLVGLLGIYSVSFVAKALGVIGGPISFIAFLFGLLGLCLTYAAWTIGFGAAVSTRLGTQDRWQPLAGRTSTPPPPPPPPATEGRSDSDSLSVVPKD